MVFSSDVRPPGGEWTALPGVAALLGGAVVSTRVAGEFVAVCNVDGVLRAFHDVCPQCSMPVGGGRSDGGVLWCPGCVEPYDVRARGVGRKRPRLRLTPLPLHADGGAVRIALSA